MIEEIAGKSNDTSVYRSSIFRPFARVSVTIMIFFVFAACSIHSGDESNTAGNQRQELQIDSFEKEMRAIEPFFQRMGKPASYDWLASHTEPGQTYVEYLRTGPKRPSAGHDTIYAMPLGSFRPEDRKLIQIVIEFLSAFYDLPIKHMQERSLTNIALRPRTNRFTNRLQWKTGEIVDNILKPSFPGNAAALIAFTTADLFSSDTTNFVFGEASIENHIGVWSLSRLHDNADKTTFLRRTLKIAAHETGHMFSMLHCTKYECLMSGTNQLAETDRRPLDTCPECTAKICRLSDISFAERYRKLIAFCRKHGLSREAREFEAKLSALKP